MDSQQPPHILLVAFPIQSHVNPALQFASRLLRSGALVTLVTTVAGTKKMNKSGGSVPAGLSFSTISDGYDDGYKPPKDKKSADSDAYMSSLKRRGSESLSELIAAGPTTGGRYTGVVYTILLSWVAKVAHSHNLPSALLWIQNAALFAIYYHYYNGYTDAIDKCDENDPEWSIQLPSLPLLRARDIPSFLAPSNPYKFAGDSLSEQFAQLERDENPIVLVNSFDALESGILDSFKPKFRISAVGPLLPPSFLEDKDRTGDETTSSSFKVDMFKRSEDDYLAWLDTKPENSVVYVSFGSISVLPKAQMEELAAALVEGRRPFLWVIRPKPEGEEEEEPPRLEELREAGMVVPWCSQVEVLLHRAVGCFVTHCGWNSTIESLAAGMPVVAVPQWTDQLTNAKMVEDVWRTGVRVRVEGTAGEEKVVGKEEIRRCMEVVMESEEMRKSARRWRELAVEATGEGGSSDVNLRAFVEEVWRTSEEIKQPSLPVCK